MNIKVLEQFIEQQEQNPIYIASKKILNNEDVPYDIQDAILKKIFGNKVLENTSKLDLMFPIIAIIGDKIPEHFIKNYQQKINNLPNTHINEVLFKSFAKEKDKFNVYDSCNFSFDRNDLYKAISENDKKRAYSLYYFINKVKDAIQDSTAIPFPYHLDENKDKKNKIIQEINLNLINNVGFLFKYKDNVASNVILKSMYSDFKYLYNNQIDNEYKDRLKNILYQFHPNCFKQYNQQSGMSMPRNVAVEYLSFNASKLDSEKFKHFARAFHSNNIDADLLVSFSKENSNKLNLNSENLIKFNENIEFLKTINFERAMHNDIKFESMKMK